MPAILPACQVLSTNQVNNEEVKNETRLFLAKNKLLSTLRGRNDLASIVL